MRKKEHGFTILEATFAILLFAVVVQMLMNFFYTMYVNSKYFEKKSMMMDNARIVNSYVKEKMREADEILITITPDSGYTDTLIFPVKATGDNKEIKGTLEKIELVYKASDGSKSYKTIFLADRVGDAKKTGKKQIKCGTLTGIGGTLSDENLLSDMLESIKVTRNKNSDDVIFTCTYHVEEPVQVEREEVIDTFSVSLAYKKKAS